MCGICGFAGFREEGLIEQMTDALAHRGPDSAGYFQSQDVSLGHRRLSIIDLAGGQQPLFNEDQTIALICNGEIYNHRELRDELCLRGHRFRTKSDCEVIVHLYEEQGPECVHKLIGMFALALYDTTTRRLFVARDRLGIKPLYYLDLPNRFVFASEFKSILRYRGFNPTLNHRALHDYLALRYVPGPGGMFDQLRKLPAGHSAVVERGALTLTRYWQPELYDGPFPLRDNDYLEGFAERFERSVQRRLMSEVPLGAYLSGGLDSSVIVAAMGRLTSTPIRTFTIGFGSKHDELADARETARALGCQHTEVACRPTDFELLPEIIYHLDEPQGDPIIVPTYQLAREAKKQVTVVLTGEGADETLGGYLFHKVLLYAHHLSRLLPDAVLKNVVSPAVAMTPAAVLNLAFDYPASLRQRGKLKVVDFLRLLQPEQLGEAYRHLISLFDDRDTGALYTDDFRSALGSRRPLDGANVHPSTAPFLNQILHLQFNHWLPENILTRQDKMSMAHAVEARVPFLDHELVEYALRVPPKLKIRRGLTKYLLRQYATRLLPASTVSKKKRAFYVPIEQWLAAPTFQAIAEDTLSESAVRNRGLFKPAAVAALRQRMRSGDFVVVKQVFSLVVLELWFRMAVDRRGAA